MSASDSQSFSEPVRWPNIVKLIESAGHITVGHIATIEGAAVAASQHTLLATLVRTPGEPLENLLDRLDHAVYRAVNDGIHINEVESGYFILAGQAPGQEPQAD